MHKRSNFVLIFLTLVLLSLLLPYALIPVKNFLNTLFNIDNGEFPTPNYVQVVASIISLVTATVISYSILFLNSIKDIECRRQDAFELYSYISESIININKFCNHIVELDIEPQTASFARILYNLKLTDEQISILNGRISAIRKIQKASIINSEIKDDLCKAFMCDENLEKCKQILAGLKKKYHLY